MTAAEPFPIVYYSVVEFGKLQGKLNIFVQKRPHTQALMAETQDTK